MFVIMLRGGKKYHNLLIHKFDQLLDTVHLLLLLEIFFS